MPPSLSSGLRTTVVLAGFASVAPGACASRVPAGATASPSANAASDVAMQRGCDPLPAVLPVGARVTLHRRDAHARWIEAVMVPSPEPCPPVEHAHVPRDYRCARVARPVFDSLHAALRNADLPHIRVRRLSAIPVHRGGFGIEMRWPGGRCAVDDMADAEVDEADRARFRTAVDALITTFNASQALDGGTRE